MSRRLPFISRRFASAAALALGLVLGIGESAAHEIKLGALVIHHPWSRQSPERADTASGFMTISNTGHADDRLVKVTSEIGISAQIMDQASELTQGLVIPAGGTVVLKPGSLHIAFTGLARQVEEGEEFTGTLAFERAGTVTVDFEVAPPDAKAP